MRKTNPYIITLVLLLVTGVAGLSLFSASLASAHEDRIMPVQAREADKTVAAEMHNQDGLALFASGKYDEAISRYNEAIRIDPDNAKAYNNRGVAYSKMGRYDLAMADYSRALQINPQFAAAYQNRSLAAYRSMDYTQACSDLKRFRELGGTPSPEFVQDLQSTTKGTC